MVDETKWSSGDNTVYEKRCGPPDRRILVSNEKKIKKERRIGLPDRRMATDDRIIHVITEACEYKGTINLNSASEKTNRISDFFLKNNNAFLTLYNTVQMGQTGKVTFINFNDIAMVLPLDDIFPSKPELRQDVDIVVKLKSGIGQVRGKVNLLSEARQVDRISDLLNYPGKRWLLVYMAIFRGKSINATIINMNSISSVGD